VEKSQCLLFRRGSSSSEKKSTPLTERSNPNTAGKAQRTQPIAEAGKKSAFKGASTKTAYENGGQGRALSRK